MKNKVLITITILAVIIGALGICLLDSTGVWFVVALIMVTVALGWGITFAIANRGCR